jgi:regulator of replication initiation timing
LQKYGIDIDKRISVLEKEGSTPMKLQINSTNKDIEYIKKSVETMVEEIRKLQELRTMQGLK